MACYHPLRGWRSRSGEVTIGKEQPDSLGLDLPCGNCLGCRMADARSWALRCTLELQQHRSAVFTTLTYDEEALPPTLEKRHLVLWLKRFRKAMGSTRPIRFFASGEYGETTYRPHYHALLYGASEDDADVVEETWGKGHCRTVGITPAAIAYVAGYAAKKLQDIRLAAEERVDPRTGEVYRWQPPFRQMSRRPGIGGHARQWPNSWKHFAVLNGQRMPAPRFLHNSWREIATPEQVEDLIYEKHQRALRRDTTNTKEQRQAAETIALRRQELKADRRKYE